MDIAAMFAGQGWFEIAGQVVLVFTALTGALPDKFVQVRDRSGMPDVLDGL